MIWASFRFFDMDIGLVILHDITVVCNIACRIQCPIHLEKGLQYEFQGMIEIGSWKGPYGKGYMKGQNSNNI